MRGQKARSSLFTLIIFVLCLGLLSSCLSPNTGTGGRRGVGGTAQEESPSQEDKEPEFSSTSQAYWFSSGLENAGNLLINQNTQQAVYLRGPSVHQFLSRSDNFSQVYCLVVSYNINNPSAKRQLRARALPISFTNFSQGSLERLLRVDLSQTSDNQSICSGNAYTLSATESAPSSSSLIQGNIQSTFSPVGICSTCSGILSSANVSLYKTSKAVSSSGLEVRPENWLPINEIDLRGLGLRIDVQSNVTDESGLCTNSACRAKGFDCCLSGQCVNDGSLRPNATTNPNYADALADVLNNPSRFTNYPEIYYVCENIVRPPQDDNQPIPDPEDNAQKLFQRDLEDFLCLEEGKKEQPEFGSAGLPRCSSPEEFATVRSQVWNRCGCRAEPFPNQPDEPACPDFGLKAITNSSGTITQILCDVPDGDVEPVPFQSLNVRVPNRTAPHRFFDTTGRAHDDLEELRNVLPQPVQEGDAFSYLDESGKTEPIDTPFSMNAILGQMNVTLNRALPAKVIYVEFDQTYVISARSGFYTPCPMCARDNWFSAFTAYPSSRQGTGLEAQGYSTSRDTYSDNNTNGNYEDTIFGRACWVPPTMIPFSHRPDTDLTTQRRNRLETQAALFANGYQRDWFGFNKGALIGSFDGVSWFAVGKGRRVQSTSQRLFLAINAPFADLTENTDTIVEIIADQTGSDTVAEMDYDTELAFNDVRQSTGASCQFFHQCSTDSDCVSKLGWEYACSDIGQYRTKWPKFDINGNEIPGDEFDMANFTRFLKGPFPQDNNRRCVYRGAGSICKRDPFNNLDSRMRKQFTCAPNFYCASLGDNTFNDRVVRTPSQIDFLLYGQGARVLGRPLHYVGALSNLTETIRSNIEHNASSVSSIASDFGICRPGKAINTPAITDQHRNADAQRRTDYISQIGSCEDQATGLARTHACPAIETRPGQATPIGDFIMTNSVLDQVVRASQNMCGGESKRLLPTGLHESTFKGIEAGPIQSLADLLNPTLAANACLRRAGSVCHTDLDCSPNKLHAEQAQFFDRTAFGGSSAEQAFWTEPLVCSQAQPRPFNTSLEYFDFDMTLNRCCREAGNTLTMYTSATTLSVIPDLGQENLGLLTGFPSYEDPRLPLRYSRYSVIPTLGSAQTPIPFVPSDRTPDDNQWRTINRTGELSCCGGGFIRKFADGTNDWTQVNRFNLPPENFACLNFRSELVFRHLPIPGSNVNNYNRDYDRFCRSPADGGCIQTPTPQAGGFELFTPRIFSLGAPGASYVFRTSPLEPPQSGVLRQQLDNIVTHQPTALPVLFGRPVVNFMPDFDFQFATSFYLPAYITGRGAITLTGADRDIFVEKFNEDGGLIATERVFPYLGDETCPAVPNFNPVNDMTTKGYCFETRNNLEILHVSSFEGIGAPPSWNYAGVRINFRPVGTSQHVAAFPGIAPQGLNPGNELYYLTKLSRFELLGVPQIFYEPLYCNTNMDVLVPGIFLPQTRADFNAVAVPFNSPKTLPNIYDEGEVQLPSQSNPTERVVYQNQINHPAIFSGHEFKCCQRLGSVVRNRQDCCSGYAIEVGTGLECRLPSGTNLNVYFNRFISSEGVGPEEPLGGLTEADFIPETGEPRLRNATLEKISQLGLRYCEFEEVRFGASHGFFYGEPFSGFYQQEGDLEASRIFSIIDSNFDSDDNDSGHFRYLEGFRWSNNLYCD
jgi:hypothetical protein